MFDDAGGKIQGFASILCVLGIIGSVILGLLMMNPRNGSLLTGILTIVIGSATTYISCLLMYGFGQLIENTDALVKKQNSAITKGNTHSEKQSTNYLQEAALKYTTPSSSKEIIKRCPDCGDIVKAGKCEMCGKEVK